jgi:SAM-dependent methyltransferase
MMTPQEVGMLLEQQSYKFAKTMPWLPHWYTLKATWQYPLLYRDIITWILRNGELRVWGKNRSIRRYFDFGDYRYWPMTTDPCQSLLLNRALISSDKSEPLYEHPSQPYDGIASSYDSMWSTPEALSEDEQVFNMLAYKGGSILDIGCGTGLFLDHHPQAQSYFGCDPSQAMLDRLMSKHPGALTFPQTFEKTIPAISDTKYDYIVSLFGSPSYVNPRSLTKINSILRPDGRLFLMFYSPDYIPVTHSHLDNPPTLYSHHFPAYGSVFTLGNYTIVQR